MIGAAREDQAPALVRKATSKIPSVKMKFNDLLDTEMNRHKIGDKVQALLEEAKCTKALSTDSQAIYNMIESRLMRAVKYTDKKCRKARKGQIPFSTKAHEIMGAYRVLKLIKKREISKGHSYRPHQMQIRRLAAKLGYTKNLNYDSLDAIEQEMKKIQGEYAQFRPRAHEFR